MAFSRGTFRVRGDTVEIIPAYEELAIRIEFFGDEIEALYYLHPLTGDVLRQVEELRIFPATHYVAGPERMARAVRDIEAELAQRLAELEGQGKLLEAQRLRLRTDYDIEMIRQVGFCSGIENYSRHIDGRGPGTAPATLIDYFPDDFLLVIDESHQTVPQIGGMYEGDMSRKRNLVDFGFRLPSAVDNRPLTWEEFADRIGQTVYLSATPGPYELTRTGGEFVEQVIRPTGLVDPKVVVKPTKGQIDDLVHEIRARTERDERVLVTTLTKKMSEDLTDYLLELGVRVRYLHSEVDTLRRVELLRQLRLGEFDVLVGINLLREGLDLPEVSLVAILDADKEGFLRSGTSLIQTIGRAARNVSGEVHMYADKVTDSMQYAIDETDRRRAKQVAYNTEHGIDPQPLRKKIADILDQVYREAEDSDVPVGGSGRNASRGKRAAGEPGRVAPRQLRGGDRPGHLDHAPRRAGRPGAAAVRPDAGRGPGPAVRAGRPAARRDRGSEEGAARAWTPRASADRAETAGRSGSPAAPSTGAPADIGYRACWWAGGGGRRTERDPERHVRCPHPPGALAARAAAGAAAGAAGDRAAARAGAGRAGGAHRRPAHRPRGLPARRAGLAVRGRPVRPAAGDVRAHRAAVHLPAVRGAADGAVGADVLDRGLGEPARRCPRCRSASRCTWWRGGCGRPVGRARRCRWRRSRCRWRWPSSRARPSTSRPRCPTRAGRRSAWSRCCRPSSSARSTCC